MKRIFLFISLLVCVAIASADNYSVAVDESETIYCTASAPANGWITHAFFTLPNASDAEYLSIENHASDLYAVITGLKPKNSITIQVTYCYSFVGSYDQDIHVGSAVYYDYVTVTGSASEGTTLNVTFSTIDAGYSDVQPLIVDYTCLLYLHLGGEPVHTDNITSYGFLMGFGDPTAFEVTMEPNKLYISIVPKREAWAYLVCEVGTEMGICKLVANSHLFNEDGVNYRCFSDGYASVFSIHIIDGDVVIPSIIDDNGEYIVTEIVDRAFHSAPINSVTIPSSVNRIGNNAFLECFNLTSIHIPNSVTEIGEAAFESCLSLDSVIIPEGITSIKNRTFYDCSNLQKVIIPSSVKSIGKYAFWGCWGLTKLNIPNSVTSIGDNAFRGVQNIMYSGTASGAPWGARNVNGVVEGWLVYSDASKTNILACSTAADTVSIPSSVISISNGAFSGCIKLSTLNIPNHVTSIGDGAFNKVANIVYNGPASGAPWGARSLNGYVEDNVVYNNASKTIVLACFAKTTGDVVIPGTVQTIGDYAFYQCTRLTSVTIPDNVLSLGKTAFYNCFNLHSVNIGNGIAHIPDATFFGCSTLNLVTIGTGLTSIGYKAFMHCWLESFTILAATPPYIDGKDMTFYSGGTNGWRTLYVLPNSVYGYWNSTWRTPFPNIEAIPDTVLYSGVCGAYILWEITTDSILNIHGRGYMTDYVTTPPWYNHRELIKEVRISDEVLSIGDRSFYDCSGIKSISVPNTIKQIGNCAFMGCSSLSAFNIPNRLTNIGDSAFYDCSALSEVHVRDVDTWCNINFASYSANPLHRAHHLYINDSEVKSISIPSNIKTIPKYSFYGASVLNTIDIHNEVKNIGDGAFADCSSITAITIPDSVIYIGTSAFQNCDALMEITNNAITPQNIDNSVFKGVNTSTCKLYVHSASINLYKKADGWKEFFHIEPMDTYDNAPIFDGDNVPASNSSKKVMINGQLIIIRHDGTNYNAVGVKL